jgi:hypothetical protein
MPRFNVWNAQPRTLMKYVKGLHKKDATSLPILVVTLLPVGRERYAAIAVESEYLYGAGSTERAADHVLDNHAHARLTEAPVSLKAAKKLVADYIAAWQKGQRSKKCACDTITPQKGAAS